ERCRERIASRGGQHLEAFGEARARAAERFGHPGEGQAGFLERAPERRLPRAARIAVHRLRIGEVGEDALRRLGDRARHARTLAQVASYVMAGFDFAELRRLAPAAGLGIGAARVEMAAGGR